jgi:hypothetical protein
MTESSEEKSENISKLKKNNIFEAKLRFALLASRRSAI